MNFPGRVASGALIFVGFLWLLSLFLNPSNWGSRSANQINGAASNAAGTQKFAVPSAQPPVANPNAQTIEQQQMSTSNAAANRTTAVPQTVDSPNQAATPAPTPTPAATPSPTPVATVVPEPVRAGW
ncbi:MAG: hypothetical protein RLZZ511_460 [Cyanobacteriota bacterium]|jgi:hypothetical protein